jgi:hypothetical protein
MPAPNKRQPPQDVFRRRDRHELFAQGYRLTVPFDAIAWRTASASIGTTSANACRAARTSERLSGKAALDVRAKEDTPSVELEREG